MKKNGNINRFILVFLLLLTVVGCSTQNNKDKKVYIELTGEQIAKIHELGWRQGENATLRHQISGLNLDEQWKLDSSTFYIETIKPLNEIYK